MAIADVFIIMPFSAQKVIVGGESLEYSDTHFDDLYDVLREAVLAYNPTCTVDRMEQRYGNLVSAIIRRIHRAEVVIAVLSGRNPNVFYELGVRHALRRGTIMLVADRREYPFDLTGYYSQQYSIGSNSDRRKLHAFIVERLTEYESQRFDDSPVLDVLDVAEREQWKALNNWETRRATVVLLNLALNVVALNQWAVGWQSGLNTVLTTEEPTEFPPMQPVFGVVEGFGWNAPLAGLSMDAYIDATNLATRLRHTTEVFEEIIEIPSDLKGDELRSALSDAIVASYELIGHLVPFAEDLLNALEYVMATHSSHSIPWTNLSDTHIQPDELVKRSAALAERWNSLLPTARQFEKRFSGAPPD